MALLHAGVDIAVIALWLGHESIATTQIYLHADMTLKERAIARITPAESKPGRYRAPDALLSFLDALWPPSMIMPRSILDGHRSKTKRGIIHWSA